MILEKDASEIPRCLSRAEGTFNMDNKPYLLMNCYDAILQNDAREVFVLDFQQIKQWSDSSCIGPQTLFKETQYIVV